MPNYSYECQKCGHAWDEVRSMSDDTCPRCPDCDARDTMKVITTVPFMRVRDSGWEYLSNGRGMYVSQLATSLDDPNAYCRSRQEAKEKARKRGLRVEDA